jgi:hypothetical protein
MRAGIVATLLLALLAGSSARASEPRSIVGLYALRIEARDDPPWRGMLGEWEMEFDADGFLHVRQIGGMTVEARYRVDGHLLMINETGGTGTCRESGVDLASALYRIHLTDTILQLRAIRDECRGRRESLPIRPWRRVR